MHRLGGGPFVRWWPIGESEETATGLEEKTQMKDRMKRAWQLAVAMAPFLAIALVEGATRRW